MDTVSCMQRAINFLEDNILKDLNPEVIASQAYMSSFHFQRVFSIICNISLGEYIRYRRLTLAGYEIISGDRKIIDIALKYGYDTPESFTRAFSRFHGIAPMTARSQRGGTASIAKITVQTLLGGKHAMNSLQERGYNVRENGAVYYTGNMDSTVRWFDEVLGWYGGIDERNENNDGTYGCVVPVPHEFIGMTLMQFNGFHLFFGEPTKQTVGFMRVDNIENLRSYVVSKGWDKISEIKTQHWGGKECDITTIDGSVIRFFQLDKIT